MPPKQHEADKGPEQPIALVLVSFGRNRLLQITLSTLFAYTDLKQVSVTIVDNGSGPEVVETLNHYRHRIDRLILLNRNWGKPYAWNLGAHAAMEECKALQYSKPTHFVFCDSDLEFREHWHQIMLDVYEEHADLPLCALSGYKWGPHPLNLQEGEKTTINQLKFCAGCCLMMSAKAFEANGLWDHRRLIRTVDTSYFRNANRRGWVQGAVHPKSVIVHTGNKQRTWQIGTGKPKLRN